METKTKTTREVILEQLQENTGRHICDSGDYYGRHFSRNQGKDWEWFTREPVRLEAHVYTHGDKPELELMGTVSLAAWMEANLEYAPEMQAQYEAWVEENDPDNDQYDLERMEKFAWLLNEPAYWHGGGPEVHNSYNGECDLSQTIQFVEFTSEGESYVLLQVHGGCDVRGGYSSPKAYQLKCDYFGQWNIDGYSCSHTQWDECLNDCNNSDAPNLKDYPVHDLVWVPTLEHDLECLKQTDKDDEETRALMTRTAETQEREFFEEFCAELTEASVVVFKRKAYLVVDGYPDEIFGECYGMYN